MNILLILLNFFDTYLQKHLLFDTIILLRKLNSFYTLKGEFAMDFLKKFWPQPFKLEKKVVKPFVIQLIIYVAIGIVLSVISAVLNLLLGGIEVVGPIVNLIMWIITTVVGLYCTAGIVFSILKFTGVFKDENQSSTDAE